MNKLKAFLLLGGLLSLISCKTVNEPEHSHDPLYEYDSEAITPINLT